MVGSRQGVYPLLYHSPVATLVRRSSVTVNRKRDIALHLQRQRASVTLKDR